MNNQAYFEDIIADLKKITLLSEKEIIDFVQSNVIGYDGLRTFYLRKARMPTPIECKTVNMGLIDRL